MKIIGLTGIRGLAISIILLYHLNQIRPIQNLALWDWKLYQFLSLLPVVVSIFFILGGFLRSLSYWKVYFEGGTIPAFWKGVKDRFFRIAPLYYFAIVVSFIWTMSLGSANWVNLLASFTFFNWVHPATFFPNLENGPLWFVAYDMMGNLIVMLWMSFLIFLQKKVKLYAGILISILFLLGFLVLLLLHVVFIALPFAKGEGIVSVWFPYYNPFIFGTYYLLGALMAGLYYWLKKKNITPHIIFDCIFLVSFGVIGYYLYSILGAGDLDYSFPKSPYRFPFIPLLIALSIFSLIFTRYIGRLLDNRIFLSLAKISYPLYLFHALIISILVKLFYSAGFTTVGEWGIFSTITIMLSIGISMLCNASEIYFTKKYASPR